MATRTHTVTALIVAALLLGTVPFAIASAPGIETPPIVISIQNGASVAAVSSLAPSPGLSEGVATGSSGNPLLGVASLGPGTYHTCAVMAGGGLKCWGDNGFGDLGDGTQFPHSTPVDVIGIGEGAVAVDGGWYHTCAVTTGGAVKCWGSNGNGQLGNNSTDPSPSPVQVAGLTSDVIAIASGYWHACALTGAGGVKCWGDNDFGQLGDGATADRKAPIDVPGLASGVTAVTAGYAHTCTLTSGGGVKC